MKIAVLLGGTSPERYVSMASGKGIAEALTSLGHDVALYDPALGKNALVQSNDLVLPTYLAPSPEELATYSNRNVIEAMNVIPDDTDVVFMALHGSPGEDGKVQAMLDLRGLRYTGSDTLSSAIAMDKAMTKRLLEHFDIPTPRWFSMKSGELNTNEIADRIGEVTAYPVVVKPNDGGSTIGLSIVRAEYELEDAVELSAAYSSTTLFEEFIEGREITVAVLGEETFPVVEIKPKSGFYDYHNKYTSGRTEYHCPADLPRALEEEIRELARRAHRAIGCGGYSRVDFRLDPDNVPYCLEINTLPGMTATSLVPKAAAAVGITYPQLCERIIMLAFNRESPED